jgi:alanyl aminopeptidase
MTRLPRTSSAWLLAALAAAAPAGATESIRLSRDVVPVHQSLRLVVDADQTNYAGSTVIDVEVRQPVTSFRFHGEGLQLARIELVSGRRRTPLQVTATADDGTLTVTAAKPLPLGKARLEIDFSNDFETRGVGLYRLETGGHAYTFTQFEAIDARKAFPCWDEPSFKIPFEVTLTVPVGHLAVSNTPVASDTLNQDGTHTVAFAETRPLPVYLVALATGPFDTVDIKGLSVPGRIVTVKGQGDLAGTAIALTPPILAALEDYFGSKYPYPKLDLLAVPEYWYGAMENAGAITFKDDILLLDPKAVSFGDKRRLASIIAHEVAHHWYGDLVTMDWWDDLWLNEAFAYWVDTWLPETLFPELALPTEGIGGVQAAMGLDATATTFPIRQPVTNVVNLLESSGLLTNQKGEALIQMTDAWLGHETFRTGVRAYMQQHAWGNTVAKDLFDALSKASGQDVAAMMSSFLDQAGVPIVSVEILPTAPGSPAQVRLTQRRFVVSDGSGDSAQVGAGQLWRIPVGLRYPTPDGTHVQRVLLTAAEQVVSLTTTSQPSWVHPNDGEVGYYRWQVAPPVLERLLAQPAVILSPRERAGLVGHLGALFRQGSLHGDAYLAALAHFADDPSPQVVDTLAGAIGGIYTTFWTPELDAAFARYLQATLGPSLTRFGLTPKPGEEEGVSLLRPDLIGWLGDRGHDATVRAYALDTAAEVLAETSAVDDEIAGAVLELAAHEGDGKLFDTLQQKFESAESSADRSRYLATMGAFRDPQIVARALDYSLRGQLRPQELSEIPRNLAQYPPQQDLVFDWMTTHYETIGQRIPPMFMAFAPYYASGCSLARLAKAETFFAQPGHDVMGTDVQLARVANGVHTCVALREREQTAVRAFLTAP